MNDVSLTLGTCNDVHELQSSYLYKATPTNKLSNEMHTCGLATRTAFKPQSLVFESFHQADLMFSSNSRGNQCTANALCSLIYAELGHMTSKHNLDSVLIDGDLLYKKIIVSLKEKGVLKSVLLNFDEIPNIVTVVNQNVTIEKCDVISGVCSQQFITADLPSLHQSLDVAFQKSSYLLVMIGSVCSAVFKKDNLYHFFDSHSHGVDGMSCFDGKSVLVSFHCSDDLVVFLYALYESMLIDITAQFDMLPVKFTIDHSTVSADSDTMCNMESIGPSDKENS